MIRLSDLLVVIPVRHDGPIRRRNLAAVIRCFQTFFQDSRLLLVEQDERPRMARFARLPGVDHLWINDSGPFHRTRLLNLGFAHAPERPIVAAWDADVIPAPEPVGLAMGRLRTGAGFAFPYDGRFIDLRGQARRRALLRLRAGRLELPSVPVGFGWGGRDVRCINHAAVGGAVLLERRQLLERGGYNERFISWGWEDTELALRMTRLGCAPVRVADYPLFHLAHPRRRDSSKLNPYFSDNLREYRRIKAMSAQDLRDDIATGRLSAVPGMLTTLPARGPSRFFRQLAAYLSR